MTRETAAKSQEKDALQKDVARLASATGIPRATVEDYVQSLSEMKFAVPVEVRNKLNSQLRNHPRLLTANPPLTVEELERIADGEIETMISSHTFSNRDLLTKIRAVLTDKQTILFSIVDQQQKNGIAKANRELYLQIKRQMAAEVQKAMKYDELTKKGITEESYKELADKGIDLVREASGKVDDIADELDYKVADMANRVASTATCLFFGFVDAAITISESSGGSGGNITELTGWDGRKKDEDERTFADRCLQTAIAMHTPKHIRQEQTRGRRWGR